MTSNSKKIGILLAVITIAYLINKALLLLFKIDTSNFAYAVEILNLFFALFSIVTLVVLQKIKQINIDIVGNAFLLLSSVKMLLSYLIVKPILKSTSSYAVLERWHFFGILIFYLMLDTLIVIYLLNTKTTKITKKEV